MDPFGVESYIQRRLNDFFTPFEIVEYGNGTHNASSSALTQQGQAGPSGEVSTRSRRLRNASARLDVVETPKTINIKIELPGIKKEDIQVHLEENVLSIQAERKDEKHEDTDRFHYSERSFGKIFRQVWLPAQVDEKSVKSQFVDGILSLELGKKVEETKRKQIQIS